MISDDINLRFSDMVYSSVFNSWHSNPRVSKDEYYIIQTKETELGIKHSYTTANGNSTIENKLCIFGSSIVLGKPLLLKNVSNPQVSCLISGVFEMMLSSKDDQTLIQVSYYPIIGLSLIKLGDIMQKISIL